MPDQPANNLLVGDLQFFDNYVPALPGGNYHIQVTHTLNRPGESALLNADPLGATQEFVVSAPQFALDPSEILAQYPPAGSTGLYAEVLPHIVLKEPLLPWERSINAPRNRQPWLALLVLDPSELIGGQTSATRAIATTVGEFLAPASGIFKPAINKEDDVATTDTCAYIQISATLFPQIMPRLDELRFLAHCRQVSIQDKASQELDPNGLFSVVVANRFPATPAAPGDPPMRSIVHLVSVEGLEPQLVDAPDFKGASSIALLSLASWTFQALRDHQADFRGLMQQIEGLTADGTVSPPEQLWLRLPADGLDTSDAFQKEATDRLSNGFVPLAYHTRTGEQTFAWYRGPLGPVLPQDIGKAGPFLTADAALIYQQQYGVFDCSLASAWEAGRAAALADKAFGQTLYDFRRRAHQLTDSLLYRLQSDHFSQSQIESLDQNTTIQDALFKLLNEQLLQNIAADRQLTPAAPASPQPDLDPKTAVQNFLADPQVQQLLMGLVKDDLAPLASWLARLLLLYPVPFPLLVADSRMLPVESLRFFYLDYNWIGALLDGALSIGIASSRDTFFSLIFHDLLQRAAYEGAQVYRAETLGVEPGGVQSGNGMISGMLLRSAIVSGWPNLAVRPYLNTQLLKILRMDHLSPNVLLCLFWGVPDTIEISEPQEGFRFGVDDDGFIPTRRPLPAVQAGDPPLGTQLGKPFQIRDLTQQQLFMRAKDSRVLNLAPDSPGGLIAGLKQALTAQIDVALNDIGPADFALQMIKSPEAIQFLGRSS